MKTDTVFDLVIFQAKQFTYKCKLDKCWPILYCFLQQVMSIQKKGIQKLKAQRWIVHLYLKWFCNKPIFKTDNFGVHIVILDLECKHTCDIVNHSMRVIQVKYLSITYFIQLFGWMAAYMSVVVFWGIYYVCISCPLCKQVYWTGVQTYVFLLYYSCYNNEIHILFKG